MNDPERSIFPGIEGDRSQWATENGCGCHTCVSEALAKKPFPDSLMFPFIVCPDCGNKRCPKATHHDNECTGSNEPGQAGSRYGGES